MNSVKTSIAAIVIVSTVASFALIRYRTNQSLATIKLPPNDDEQGIESVPRVQWEYFRALPNRLAANYYPHKETHELSIVEPVLKTEEGEGIFNLTFLVKSKTENYARRKVIRKTWGSISTFRKIKLHLIFVIGTSKNSENQVGLESEAEKYGDILQVNVLDTFSNMPKKFLSAFYWIRKSPGTHTKFYVVTEDTCVVNIAMMMNFLLDHQKVVEKSIHCGYMFENNTAVIRGNGPRSVTKEMYPKGTYPAFCRGQLVILSLSNIEKIHEASMSTNITGFHLDDVLLYGILREKLGIKNSIKNVINGGRPLVYYPWDDSENVINKMHLKWKEWKKYVKLWQTLSPKNVDYNPVFNKSHSPNNHK